MPPYKYYFMMFGFLLVWFFGIYTFSVNLKNSINNRKDLEKTKKEKVQVRLLNKKIYDHQ